MGPRGGAEIGAAGGDSRVGVISLGDRTDRKGWNLARVADEIGERRLDHWAVDRLVFFHDLA